MKKPQSRTKPDPHKRGPRHLWPPRQTSPELLERLERLETRTARILELLEKQEQKKEWYTPAEFGEVVGKAPFTVQTWCRTKRIRAEKSVQQYGRQQEWRISHEELLRYRNHGLRPVS